ncbi:VOC family protein [Leucobacter sp. PH1c]|uniref:VOC family protein n=1 Tax=Leucobacter sp. PH1c TaxID=1397278 RepID=UPI0004A808F1|nr:VOC family protein [Leucobacter sp. PH1c]
MSAITPIGVLSSVVLDCPDPQALAEFYRAVLGGVLEPDDDDWVDLILPGGGLRIGFQRAPEYAPPVWPGDDGAQQSHLDIAVGDLDLAQRRLLDAGARLVDAEPTFRVYLDPVGHPFCTIH